MRRILFLIVVATVFVSCKGGANQKSKETAVAGTEIHSADDVTRVLYFHGKQRCVTCNAIEKLTQEVVDSLANEKIEMQIIDISQKANEAIADKYEVTWASLIIDRGGQVKNLTEVGFEYAKNQPQTFKDKLVEVLCNGMQ